MADLQGPVSRASTKPPWPLAPMLAKASEDLPRDADAYGYELKWDGFRTLLLCDQGKARVQSRNLRDVTSTYPELQGIAKALRDRHVVLDGELVVLGEDGMPKFEGMQRRAGFEKPLPGQGQEPVTFLAFDVVWVDGSSLLAKPYPERREALEGLGLQHESVWVPPWSPDGATLREASVRLKLEGVVAKRLTSPYEPGKRTGAWLKVRNIQRQEFVVGGYTLGQGGRSTTLGALLVGYHDEARLRFAGSVGTGFTDRTLVSLTGRLQELRSATCPFAEEPELLPGQVPVWVAPRLVCEVKFATWTHDGVLRHASFLGLREDKDPSDVVREVT